MHLRASLLTLAGLLIAAAPASAQTRKHRPAAPALHVQQWVNLIVSTPEGGVRQGNPAAKTKLVEYGSRSCPVCKRFADEGVAELRAKYIATGKVSYEYREFWVHPPDPGLSLVGYCVPVSSFFNVLDEMYVQQGTLAGRMTDQMQTEIEKLPRAQQPGAWARRLGYVSLLTRRHMLPARINQCLGNVTLLNKLLAQIKIDLANGVQGTPTFFINGQKADAITWADLEPLLKSNGN